MEIESELAKHWGGGMICSNNYGALHLRAMHEKLIEIELYIYDFCYKNYIFIIKQRINLSIVCTS